MTRDEERLAEAARDAGARPKRSTTRRQRAALVGAAHDATRSPKRAPRIPTRASSPATTDVGTVGHEAASRPRRHDLRRRRRAISHAIARHGRRISRSAPRSSLADAFAALNADWPELHEAWQRFASVPIRNSATLGGNIANGSPIGDSMPALIALGARVVLRDAATARARSPLDEFYPGYQKTARAARRIRRRGAHSAAPRPRSRCARTRSASATTRTSRRCSPASRLTIDDGAVRRARIGCGGVAPTPVRARQRPKPRSAGAPGTPRRPSARGRARATSSRRSTTCARAPPIGAAVLGNLLRAMLPRDRRRRMEAHARSTDARRFAAPRGRAAMNARQPRARRRDDGRRAGAARFGARCTSRARRRTPTTCPSRAARCTRRVGVSAASRTGRSSGLDLDAVRSAPGVVAVLDGRRHSRA